MTEFTLERSESMLQRVGQHPAIEIVDVGEDTIECRSLDVETIRVADLSDHINGYSNYAHAWEEYRKSSSGQPMYQTVCTHMTGIPSTLLPSAATDNDSWWASLDDIERANIPCDHCKHLLSDR